MAIVQTNSSLFISDVCWKLGTVCSACCLHRHPAAVWLYRCKLIDYINALNILSDTDCSIDCLITRERNKLGSRDQVMEHGNREIENSRGELLWLCHS